MSVTIVLNDSLADQLRAQARVEQRPVRDPCPPVAGRGRAAARAFGRLWIASQRRAS